MKDYHYCQNGAYFITICVKEKHELLGKIFVGDGVLDVPQTVLSEYGKIVKNRIQEMDRHYNHLDIVNHIVMPNHIHLLIVINGRSSNNGTSRTPSPTNAVIPALVSALKRFVHKECGFELFQRAYHDHIIRDEEDYLKHCKYIDENPLKWEKDEYYQGTTNNL